MPMSIEYKGWANREEQMGIIKKGMIEHRMTTEHRKTYGGTSNKIATHDLYSKTLDRSTGANDHLSKCHWVEEIRNSMYQLSDEELVSFLTIYTVEAERLRVCLRMVEYESREPDQT